MTVVTIVLSQSTSASAPADVANYQSTFAVEFPHSIPVSGTVEVVSYSIINADHTTQPKTVEVDIDWLGAASTHIVGSSWNAATSASADHAAHVSYDQRRKNTNALILPNRTEHYVQDLTGHSYQISGGKIPQVSTVKVRDAMTGLPYNGVVFMTLTLKCQTRGFF